MTEAGGGFVLVHVSTPLEVCEQRDRKGLYARGRAGIVQHFTSISDLYETPTDTELVIDATDMTPEEAVLTISPLLGAFGVRKSGGLQGNGGGWQTGHDA